MGSRRESEGPLLDLSFFFASIARPIYYRHTRGERKKERKKDKTSKKKVKHSYRSVGREACALNGNHETMERCKFVWTQDINDTMGKDNALGVRCRKRKEKGNLHTP